MHNNSLPSQSLTGTDHTAITTQTARWTSPAYGINFGHIAKMPIDEQEANIFRFSAWGLSSSLSRLLAHYPESQVKASAQALIADQHEHVIVALEQIISGMNSEFYTSDLDHIFVTVPNCDMFLAGGLRLPVTCVTNILQVKGGPEVATLNKFVAVLDAGEVQPYITERMGMIITRQVYLH
ncbi:MAG: hypothetical protein ACFE0Q_04650 [Anaerolineae bacterium]